jgi:hypothetical protein
MVRERNGTIICLDHMYRLALRPPDPIRELDRIGSCGAEENKIDIRRKHDDDFLPYHASLCVVNVVDFIKNYVFNVSN